jgi:hypothetical protein
MRVWLLAKVFHTCGKNCGKSRNLMQVRRFTPFFAAIQTVWPRKGSKTGLAQLVCLYLSR